MRPIKGVTLVESDISNLIRLTNQMRIDRLIEQRDRIWEFLDGNVSIKEHFDSAGLEICQTLLDYNGSITTLHPIVFEINHRGVQVIQLLENLDCLETIRETDVPILPVEYIPLLDNSVYFGDKHKLISKYRSSLAVKAYKQLHETEEDFMNAWSLNRPGDLFQSPGGTLFRES